MAPGGVQNEPQMHSKSRKIRRSTPNGPQMASQTQKLGRCRRFWTIFGSPLGSQNRPQMQFFRKMAFQGPFLCAFFVACCFFSFLRRFGSIFKRPDPQKVTTLTGISHFFDFLKNLKKCPSGTPTWPPNGQELAKEVQKITKIAKKTIILRG